MSKRLGFARWRLLPLMAAVMACSASTNMKSGQQRASGQTNTAANGGSTGTGLGGGAGSSVGQAGSGSGPNNNNNNKCASADVRTTRVKPRVWLVIDGSGSMTTRFDATGSRWQVLRSALLDPTAGIVPKLQATVEFGMVMYDGPLSASGMVGGINPGCGCYSGYEPVCSTPACATGTTMGPAAGMMMACPRLVTVAPAFNNFNAISAKYPNQPLGGSTPTDKAVDYVMNNVAMPQGQMLDTNKQPEYIVLATDGAPNDLCSGMSAGGGASNFDPVVAQRVIDATMKGAAKGAKMFVISMAGSDAQLQMHLVNVAQAGNTGSPPFAPANKNALVDVFAKIIGGAIGCKVTLSGKVMMGQECLGTVDVGGQPLKCNAADGWHLLDDHTLEVTGKSCTDFLSSTEGMLHAVFPCGVFVPE